MSLNDVIPLVELKEGVSIGGLILIVLLTIIQITPIKLNPWDKILSWIGNKLNSPLKVEVDELKKSVEKVGKKLSIFMQNKKSH